MTLYILGCSWLYQKYRISLLHMYMHMHMHVHIRLNRLHCTCQYGHGHGHGHLPQAHNHTQRSHSTHYIVCCLQPRPRRCPSRRGLRAAPRRRRAYARPSRPGSPPLAAAAAAALAAEGAR